MCIPLECFWNDAYMSNSATVARDILSKVAIATSSRVDFKPLVRISRSESTDLLSSSKWQLSAMVLEPMNVA